MPRRVKAYLPRWMLRVMMPVMFLIWLLVTYMTFRAPDGQRIELVPWLILTGMFVLIGAMLYLLGSGKLHAYEIELDDDVPPKA